MKESHAQLDPHLCGRLAAATKLSSDDDPAGQDMPPFDVYLTFNLEEFDGHPIRPDMAPTLVHATAQVGGTGWFRRKNFAHARGLVENGRTVRAIPLQHFVKPQSDVADEREEIFALSLKVARAFTRDPQLPKNGLLQFVPVDGDLAIYPISRFRSGEVPERIFRDRFVLVGADTKDDTWNTVDGEVPGVVIHAQAAEAILSGSYIERTPLLLSILAALALAWVLAARWQKKGSPHRLLFSAGLATLIMVIIAATAMYVSLQWIEILYPILAVWIWYTVERCAGARLGI